MTITLKEKQNSILPSFLSSYTQQTSDKSVLYISLMVSVTVDTDRKSTQKPCTQEAYSEQGIHTHDLLASQWGRVKSESKGIKGKKGRPGLREDKWRCSSLQVED